MTPGVQARYHIAATQASARREPVACVLDFDPGSLKCSTRAIALILSTGNDLDFSPEYSILPIGSVADEGSPAVHRYCHFRVLGPPIARVNLEHLVPTNQAHPSKAVVTLTAKHKIGFA